MIGLVRNLRSWETNDLLKDFQVNVLELDKAYAFANVILESPNVV